MNEFVVTDNTAPRTDQIKEILNKLNSTSYEWLLITQQYDFPFEGSIHKNEEDLLYDLSNIHVCRFSTIVIAIYKKGRCITDAEIKNLKEKAII